MPTPQFQQVYPVLPVRDLDRAIHFYVERLGFQLTFRDGTPGNYAGLRRDAVVLHIQWHAEEDFKGVEAGTLMLRFRVDDPDALHAEYTSSGATSTAKPVRDTPWGTREFAFFDPDGNGLTFFRALS